MLELLSHYLLSRYAVLALLVICVLYFPVRRVKVLRDVARLGVRASVIKSDVFGLKFLFRAIRSFQEDRFLEFWDWMFEHNGAAAKGSYTSEVIVMNNTRVILTADPENMKAILTTQFTDYGKGERFHREWKEFLGDSIFTTDGAQWHDSRQLIRPMFIRERVGDLDLFETHVQELISLLGPGDGRMVQMDDLLSRFSLDAATEFLLGDSAGSLGSHASHFQGAFDDVQGVQAFAVRAGELTRLLVNKKPFYAGLRVMESFVEPYITQALAMSPRELEQKLSKSDTFVHALARFTRSRAVIRDQLFAVLLAGRDTTASTLSWAILELARNPRVVDRLRTEIAAHVGNRPPSYEDIKDMKYLTAIINETLRLYPVVPVNVRESLRDTTLPRGGGPQGMDPVGVPRGTSIVYSTLMMHRRRDLYPPLSEAFPYEPCEWVPERWATWTPRAWQFIPFNGGPRICIGQNFAMTEMAYVLIRIFQTFDTVVDYGNKAVLKAVIVLTPGEGVKVGFGKSANKVDSEKTV